MNRKKILALIDLSYTKGVLDKEKTLTIASILSRKELKDYIRKLKDFENQKKVIVTTPVEVSEQEKKTLSKNFEKKNLEFLIDPDILGGIKIQENDIIYEVSLKKTLDDMIDFLSEKV